jgi:hypothetical protein
MGRVVIYDFSTQFKISLANPEIKLYFIRKIKIISVKLLFS